MQQRLSLADRDDFARRRKWKKLMKPPDAAQAQRIVSSAPFIFEIF
jgi:hypothetical protein